MPAITTLVGFIGGLFLFVLSIISSTDTYIIFLSVPSIILVLGGTLAATFISYDSRDILGAVVGVFSILRRDRNKESHYREDIKAILDLSNVQRADGRIALESNIPKRYQKDPFISFAIDLVVSNYKSTEIRMMLTDIMMSNFEKGFVRSSIMRSMASYSPAFGMIGTIIGLIIILSSFGGDISQLGQGLSLALITTLYGVILANFLFAPAAEKIARLADKRQYREKVMLEGFVLLADRKSGLAIQDKLNSLLTPEIRYRADKSK